MLFSQIQLTILIYIWCFLIYKLPVSNIINIFSNKIGKGVMLSPWLAVGYRGGLLSPSLSQLSCVEVV